MSLAHLILEAGFNFLPVTYAPVSYTHLDVYKRQVTALLVEQGRCCGVVAWDLVHGGLQVLRAKAVILATGGSGRVFSTSTNAVINTGDGMALRCV